MCGAHALTALACARVNFDWEDIKEHLWCGAERSWTAVSDANGAFAPRSSESNAMLGAIGGHSCHRSDRQPRVEEVEEVEVVGGSRSRGGACSKSTSPHVFLWRRWNRNEPRTEKHLCLRPAGEAVSTCWLPNIQMVSIPTGCCPIRTAAPSFINQSQSAETQLGLCVIGLIGGEY